jgi:uncharacterized membrane protein YozB (DUF420 family)
VSIFSTSAPFLSDLNLILQIVIAAFLIVALFAALREKYMVHGLITGCSVTLSTISILIVMVPSLLALKGVVSGLSTSLSLIVVTHAVVGTVVEILGVLLVASWVLEKTRVDNCFRRKYIMMGTIILWLCELVLGVYVYLMLYPFV